MHSSAMVGDGPNISIAMPTAIVIILVTPSDCVKLFIFGEPVIYMDLIECLRLGGMNSIGKYYPCLFVFEETE